MALWGLWRGCYGARRPKRGTTPGHSLTPQNSPSTYSLHRYLCAPGPLSRRWGCKNERGLPMTLPIPAPSPGQGIHAHLLEAQLRATRFRDRRLRLREGKRLAQGHTASKWPSKELNPGTKSSLHSPAGPPSRSSPPPPAPFLRQGEDQSPPPWAPVREVLGSSFLPPPPCPHLPATQDVQVRDPRCVCAAPGKPCRLQGHPPVNFH